MVDAGAQPDSHLAAELQTPGLPGSILGQRFNRISVPEVTMSRELETYQPVGALFQAVQTDVRLAFHAVEARAQLLKGAVDLLNGPFTRDKRSRWSRQYLRSWCAFP